ncbi:MAG: efflux transporter outer membrane subunit [Alistipes sp.]|nr:efflux transporter outer membrane subunit [Candidatus Alistipes equi]
MKYILILITSLFVLSGCSVFKKYKRPESVKTESLFGKDQSFTDSVTIADLSWREFFQDPYLQRLIDSALIHNSSMRIAAQRILQSEATLKTARLAFLPSLSFEPSFESETNKKYDGTKFGYSLPLKASWEIDIAGRLLNNKRQKKSAYESSLLYEKTVQTELIKSVANCYYTLLMLDAQMEVSKKTAASWKANVRTMKAMKEAGMTNEASISRTEANSCSIEASLFDLEYDIIKVENSLALLLGTTPQHFERGRLSDQKFPERLNVGIPALLLSRRPDLQVAEKNLEEAFYGTNIARSQLYPSLTLTGSGGWRDAINNPTQWFISLAGKLASPIFNAGRNRANLKIAKASQQQALISFQQSLLQAGSEVNDAMAVCRTSMAKNDLREKQITALESAVNSTRQLMSHSQSTYLEVLTAQQALLSAQLQQISDHFDTIKGIVNLYSALGGGAD